ncbi:MAG: hypothetical protein WCI71_02195 [Bacteroidota bacterium]
MAQLKGKHTISVIEGVPCTVIETGVSPERATFLKEILSFNGYEVKTEAEKAKDGTSQNTAIIGITDILINPVVILYQKKLFRKDGEVVSPAYWYQWPDQWEIPYWKVQR